MEIGIPRINIKDTAVPQDLAMEELQKWFDYKKARVQLVMETNMEDEDEEQNAKEVVAIIEAIMCGDLLINEDMSMVYELLHPIKDEGGSVAFSTITLKPRMTAAEVQAATKGLTKKEPFKLFVGYVSQLSGELRGVINKLDSTDFSLLQKIVGYFL